MLATVEEDPFVALGSEIKRKKKEKKMTFT